MCKRLILNFILVKAKIAISQRVTRKSPADFIYKYPINMVLTYCEYGFNFI